MSHDTTGHSRRAYLKAVGAAGLSVGIAGCLGGLGGSGGPVEIGAVLPFSGDLEVFGVRNENGMDLALEDINSEGLLGNRELDVSIEDTQTAPETGVSAAQKLVNQDGVPSLIGAVSSGVTLAISESVTIPNEIVQVATASTSAAITDLEDDDYILRTATSSALQGKAMAQQAVDNGIDSMSFVYVNNAYGSGFADSMEEAFEDLGGTGHARVPYESGKSSYRPELNEAMEGNPEALVFVSYPESFTTLIKQAFEMGLKEEVQYLASDGIVSDAVEENVPAEAINGMIGLNPAPPVESEAYQDYLNLYEETYDKTPTIWSAYAYDATMLTAIAIEAAGEAESTPIRDHIYDISRPEGTKVANFSEAKAELEAGNSVDYDGVSGSVNLSDAGDVPGTYLKWEVVDGEFKMGELMDVSA